MNTDTPIIYYPKNSKERDEQFSKLSSDRCIDEIDQQLEEIFFIRHPTKNTVNTSASEIEDYKKTLIGPNLQDFGIWVYYPWNHYMVHFMPEDLHQELRTARNRNLITLEEQDKFYNAPMGIAGLSVGNSAMATILYTGGGKYLRLADHDILSASNLNRIRSSFTKLGMKKVQVAAQEIYEVNPFAKLQLFSDGLSMETLSTFLLKPKPLQVLIEEMDNIYLKIQIRLLARKHRIPVIMAADNGDNVVLDVERFDIEPDRPLFHGDIPESELLAVTPNLSKPEAARMITRWVHPENVAHRMKLSLMELGKTLYSWPQLGNAAFLAGCTLAYSAKKIINKEPIKSGKYQISLDHVLMGNSLSEKDKIEQSRVTDTFRSILHL